MKSVFAPRVPKKPVNLTINVELLSQARQFKLRLSSVLEQALVDVIREKKSERWLSANRDTIHSYNLQVGSGGLHGDPLRRF
jgi:antitoxin CcdA